ncbi:50S ribosomal protein L25 [Buchnera aphidicola (Mindarus keteleerifoliae)]|uniref:50S ribosomal protein L25 n=1 Tax=Buchnera aphidicola TaxID=9 RepID=UPI0031B6D594
MLIIHATQRDKIGKSASRLLRTKNKFPAIVYGKKKPTLHIQIDNKIIINSTFFKKNIRLIICNEKYIVSIKEIHYHAFKPKIIHIDFIYIDEIK